MNHKEISLLLSELERRCTGLSLDRVFIPARPAFSEKYLKSEWVFRLGSKSKGCDLLLSLRNQTPYLAPYEHGTFKNFPAAPHSGFDLSLLKHLTGRRILHFQQVKNDRWIQLCFSGDFSIWLGFIPAAPQGILVDSEQIILGQNRTPGLSSPFAPFPPRENPEERVVHFVSSEKYAAEIQEAIDNEAFALRTKHLDKNIRDTLKTLKKLAAKNQEAVQKSNTEGDWLRYGDLLKHSSFEKRTQTPQPDGTRSARDYSASNGDEWIVVPCDPALDLQAQIRKFYSLEKRKQKRFEEASRRLQRTEENILSLEQKKEKLAEFTTIDEIEALEKSLGWVPDAKGKTQVKAEAPGRVCVSEEGLVIRVGRDRFENLELTLRHAKGKDMWLHIKGRPSSHAVIELPPKKSASLETLLDAAHLVLHFSKAQDWGKTEVDYTYRKNVRRIPQTDEVAYSQNKTLIVEHDQKRINRLLSDEVL